MRHAVELLGLIAAGLFTGGALFAGVVEHPARVEAGVDVALAQFAPSYRRAALLEGGAAVLTFVLCLTATALGGSVLWLLGGVVIGVVVPLTFSVLHPVNRRIIEARAGGAGDAEVKALLHRWGRLHEVRTALGVAGFVLVAVAALKL